MTRREFVPNALAALQVRRRYRVAIIGHTGRGNFGHDWDLTWNRFPNVEVVAVADPVEEGRTKAMARSRARTAYADYNQMLRAEKPDIVIIAPRWVDQRVAMVTAAAEAGAHVLMEKPFAGTVADADRMVEAVERRRVKVQVGHAARPVGVTQAVRKLLLAGELGTLMEMRARGKEDRRAGGEDLMVLGTHDFDLMRYFAGDPQWVFASFLEKGRAVEKGMEREPTEPVGRVAGDDVAAMFRFAGGVAGYFGSKRSEVTDGRRFGVTLCGSKATVYVPLSDTPSGAAYLQRGTAWAGGAWERIDYPEGTRVSTREEVNALLAADLMEAIEKGREPVCNHLDGRWTIEMVAGMYQSHYAGRRVEFPLLQRM